MSTYYNDNDPTAAAWLRALIDENHLPAGSVDPRSVTDVQPEDTAPVSHFFAGIGGWPYALRLAGWPDGEPVWTASLPCQPFSQAGLGKGKDDDRHLWPVFYELVAECLPPILFGEQVASPAGRAWLAAVRLDLEALGYAVGAADLCAAGAGAPQLRQRLFWGAVRVADAGRIRLRADAGAVHGRDGCGVADAHRVGLERGQDGAVNDSRREAIGDGGGHGGMGHTGCARLEGRRLGRDGTGQRAARSAGVGSGGLGHADGGRLPGHPEHDGEAEQREARDGLDPQRPSLDTWSPSGLVLCADGRARPLAPIARRVADGVPARVGLLRGYGNAIVPQIAAEFVAAFMDSVGGVG